MLCVLSIASLKKKTKASFFIKPSQLIFLLTLPASARRAAIKIHFARLRAPTPMT
jgi:hypothetical protein